MSNTIAAGCRRLKTACFISLQDKVEAADCGRAGAAGGSWELLRPAEDVPVPVFLPAEPGVQPGPRGGLVPVQGPLGAPAGPTETAGPADPPARAAGGRRAAAAPAASSTPHVRSASPACAAAVSRASC